MAENEAAQSQRSSPTTRLAQQLRQHRLDSEITVAELARRVGVSRPKISKIEHGRVSVSATTLTQIADALALPPSQLALLTGLLHEARHRSLIAPADPEAAAAKTSVVSAEHSWGSVALRSRQARVHARTSIPALLQAPEYVSEMLHYLPEIAPQRKRARLEMQAAIYDGRCHFTLVFRERHVRSMPLSPLGRCAQLSHLLEFASAPNIEYRIVPDTARTRLAGDFDYTIYDNSQVWVDIADETIIKRTAAEVRRHRQMFDNGLRTTLDHVSSVQLITDIADKTVAAIDLRDRSAASTAIDYAE